MACRRDSFNRRDIVRALLCGGGYIATLGFQPLQARKVALMSNWDGFVAPLQWQPFKLVTGDTIVIPITVGGRPVEAILDSGSAASIVSSSLAEKLGMTSNEQRIIRGVGGRASVLLARNVVVDLAGERRRLPFVVISDLKSISSALGRPVDAVLGEDMLTQRCLALDFNNSRLSLGASGRFDGGQEWKRMLLSHGSNRELLVDASVAGLPNTPMIFDLGNSTALMLDPAFVGEHNLLQGIRQSTAVIGGVDGITPATTFMAKHVMLGESRIPSVPALTPSTWISTSAKGSVGLPLISQFDVVLDVTAKQLWLRPAWHAPPMLEDHTGFGLSLDNGQLSVVHVAAHSPAAKEGWRAGDRVLAINDRKIDESYIKDQHWRWRFMPPGTMVTLRDQIGRVRKLVLADYY